jgi:hypothetical protein
VVGITLAAGWGGGLFRLPVAFDLSLALSGAGTTALVGVEVDDGGPGTAWVLAS